MLNAVNIPFGGSFTAITTGICANPATITVVDATGQTTTATLHNLLGRGRATACAGHTRYNPGLV